MPTFAYQARDKAGQPVKGTSEAPDKRAALESLREQGYFVTSLASAPAQVHERSRFTRPPTAQDFHPVTPSPIHQGVPVIKPEPRPREWRVVAKALLTRASKKDLSVFFRQMHAMLNAGTSIGRALSTLSEHGTNGMIKTACGEMSRRTTTGEPWSDTMRAYPALFSELAIAMISAGEKGGFLDSMCLRLAEYCERDYHLQQAIKKETWYPKLLVANAVLIPSSVPLVLAAMSGKSWFSAWWHSVSLPVFVIVAILIAVKVRSFLAPIAVRDGPLRYVIDLFKLYIPIVGKTTRALATAKLCRAMAALYASGMGPRPMMSIAADTCGNAVMADRVRKAIPRMERGEGLTKSLEWVGYFPGIALTMLATGEDSGNIDTQLEKAAEFLEADAETTIKQSVPALGMLAFLCVAVYIGMTVVQFYSGYTDQLNDLMNQN